MKNLGLMTTFIAGFFLMGCLENKGGQEAPKNLNNQDFSVVVTPGTGTQNQNQSQNSNIDNNTASIPTDDAFEINKGDVLAASTALNLNFNPPFSSAYIKISENNNCTDGAWENYASSVSFESSKKNQNISLSVLFRDYDGRTSACYTRSIFVDEAGPDIVFAKYPSASVEEGSDIEIVFSVTDPGAGVSEVTCHFGTISKPCSAGQNTVTFPQMASGDYTFTVDSKDKLGLSNEKSISFTVTGSYRKMVQNVRVNENKKVDILIVIDNSGSMAYEQKNMSSRVRNFLNVIKGLDWQIAVTTTDPDNKPLGDGRLVPLYGKKNSYILTSSMADADAQSTLGMTLQRPETGSPNEQGINAAYRAVERSLASSGGNSNFIRSDAQLAVVVISDEDESANGPKNDPANFVKFIANSFNGQKSMSFHSIITRPNDKACLTTEGYSYGFRYDQLSKLTGGVIGDVCAMDYAAQVQGIAEGVRKTLKSITLSCSPVIDSMRSLLVLKDGQVFDGGRKMEGLNMVFDDMLPAGNYEVHYSCLK
ncbi:MAG: hypothetical protein ACXVCY_04060 [Pseudobdellovibrionaceae bacterium]